MSARSSFFSCDIWFSIRLIICCREAWSRVVARAKRISNGADTLTTMSGFTNSSK